MEIPVHDVVNTGTELFREGTQGFINVCLARESASQPWGFRLQGGKDRGLPFQLLKVSSSPLVNSELNRESLLCSGPSGQHRQPLRLQVW